MTVLLIAAAVFVSMATAAYAAFAHVDERATVRASLRQLGDYEVTRVRDKQLLEGLGDRLAGPVLGGLVDLGRRLTPVGYADKVRKKMVVAGKPTATEYDRFLAVRVLTLAALVLPLYILFTNPLHLHGILALAVPGLLGLALLLGPDATLNRKVVERQDVIRVALPDILDLLTISVEAGLGFEQALDRTVQSVPGPLSDEFIRMLNEVRAGSTRADAMRAIDARTDVPEVRSFVLAILQADTFGVSIGKILRAQADEMRIKRRQLAQEKAQKAPVKMLLPMVFCIFPALFVVVLGPAAINIVHNFGKH